MLRAIKTADAKPFKVLIDIRYFKGATKCFRIEESYDNWAQADAAYEHWHGLTKVRGSVVEFAELVEDRAERTHKTSKPVRTVTPSNVRPLNTEVHHADALQSI
jgi:hypothetical protein